MEIQYIDIRSGVELEFLFNSMSIVIDDKCFVFPDGRQFCTNDDYSLKFYVNQQKVEDLRTYVVQDRG